MLTGLRAARNVVLGEPDDVLSVKRAKKWTGLLASLRVSAPGRQDLRQVSDRPADALSARWRRNIFEVTAWGVIVCVMLTISITAYDTYQLGVYFDDARYVILARSLLESDRYGMINVPGPPQVERYPFVFPLVLTIPMRLFPGNVEALKAPSLILTVINVGLLFWGWRRLTGNSSQWLRIAVVGLYAFAPLVIGATRRVMSEPLFTTFCLITLLLAQWRVERQVVWLWTTCFGLALTVALFTRTGGIVLVVTAFGYLFARLGWRFWREAILVLLQMAIVLACVVNTTTIRLSDLIPTEYLRDQNAEVLDAALQRIVPSQISVSSVRPAGLATTQPDAQPAANPLDALWQTIRFYLFQGVRRVAVGIGGGDGELSIATRLGLPVLPAVISVTVVAVVLLGLVRVVAVRSGGPFAAWFALAFSGALLLWTGKDERLLYPIAPQILWGLVQGLDLVALGAIKLVSNARRTRSTAYIAVAGVVAVLLAGSLFESTRPDDSRWHTGDLTLRTGWLSSHGSPDDVVMTEAPEADFIYSGHRTVSYPPSHRDTTGLEEYVRAWNVRYVLIAPEVDWHLPTYSPTYSLAAKDVYGQLMDLKNIGTANLVYDGGQDRISVFDVSGLS